MCGSYNKHTNEQYEEAWGSLVLSEVDTECSNPDCGYKGYWSYGWYSEELTD